MDFFKQIGWNASIGDPSFMGWLTVVAYFCVAVLAFKVSFSSSDIFSTDLAGKQKIFWSTVAIILLFLGLNKQLDLQSLLTAMGKFYAKRDGWYENRRELQMFVILGAIIVMVTSFLLFVVNMGEIFKTNRLAIIGLAFLVLFIALRATSFHHMDMLINFTVFGMRMNWILELSGIVAIFMSAFALIKNQGIEKVQG